MAIKLSLTAEEKTKRRVVTDPKTFLDFARVIRFTIDRAGLEGMLSRVVEPHDGGHSIQSLRSTTASAAAAIPWNSVHKRSHIPRP